MKVVSCMPPYKAIIGVCCADRDLGYSRAPALLAACYDACAVNVVK